MAQGFALRYPLRIACSAFFAVASTQAAQPEFDPMDLLETQNTPTVVPYLAPAQVHTESDIQPDFLNFGAETIDMINFEQHDHDQFRRKIWQTRLEPVNKPLPSNKNNDLIEASSKLSSMRMPEPSEGEKRKAQAKEFLEKIDTASLPQVAEPNTKQNNVITANQASDANTANVDFSQIVARSVEEAMKDLSKVSNPLELADVLYKDGKLKQAAFFYKMAYEKLSNRFAKEADLAWTLFQIGNCVRHTEPSEAIISYKQLISQYPQSPWSGAAQTLLDTIEWQKQEKPQEVIRK